MEKNKLTTSTAEETVTISRTEYEDLLEQKRQKPGISVWVEPISPDAALRNELRGRYRICDTFVENDIGHRFPLSSYMARWLAFFE